MSWQSGDPEARPKVYLPQGDGEAPLAYEAYHDPAEAHGWRKSYADGDETAVLDIVPGGRAERREQARGHRRTRLTRRLAVAGGAACVVVLGVAVVGAFGPGDDGGPDGAPGRTEGPVRLATGPAEPAGDDSPAAAASAGPPGDAPSILSRTVSATPSATVSTLESASAGAASPGGSASASVSAAPTAPAPANSASPTPGVSATGGTGGHGHGHGHGHGG
jgi:hypothetical protein